MSYVMLVEDNQDNADLIIRALSSDGYQVRHFVRGLAALSAVTKEKPAIILLDFNLPDIDGRTLILGFKRKLGDEVPVVAVTARVSEMDQRLAISFGASAFIGKPFDPRDLVLTVQRLLNASAAHSTPAGETTS
jgi:two-component system response regulator CssR